jgi:hypothetical protein
MKPEDFYPRIIYTAQQTPEERHRQFRLLHEEVLYSFTAALSRINAAQAEQTGSDGRTIAQIVGHIAEWDRYTLLAFGELLAGVEWPQIMNFNGYLEPDGTSRSFSSVDEFNAYCDKRFEGWDWKRIQNLAMRTAVDIHALLDHPMLLTTHRMEHGRPFTWPLPTGVNLSLPVGWYLWEITLEHEAVEHAHDIGMK